MKMEFLEADTDSVILFKESENDLKLLEKEKVFTIIMSVCVYLGTFGIFNTKPHLYKSEHLHRGKPDLVDVSVSSHLIGQLILFSSHGLVDAL